MAAHGLRCRALSGSGDVDGARRAEVTVTLARRAEPDPAKPASREEFAARYGADPASIERLEAFVGRSQSRCGEVHVLAALGA